MNKTQQICKELNIDADLVVSARRAYRLHHPLSPEELAAYRVFMRELVSRRTNGPSIPKRKPTPLSRYQYKVQNGTHHLITKTEREANNRYHRMAGKKRRANAKAAKQREAVSDQDGER